MISVYQCMMFILLWREAITKVNPRHNGEVIMSNKFCQHLCNFTPLLWYARWTDFMIVNLSCRLISTPGSARTEAKRKYIVKECQGLFTLQDSPTSLFPTPNTKKRLLLLPDAEDQPSHHAQQLLLHNNSLIDYPSIRVANPIAMAYMYSQRKLIVATRKPYGLHVYLLDSNENATLRHDVQEYCGMAIDESKQLVFLASTYPGKRVFVMTTEGKQFKPILRCESSPGIIAVDSKRSRIFVEFKYKFILMCPYAGSSIRIAVRAMRAVVRGMIKMSFHIDTEEDVLYYSDESQRTIFKTSLSNMRILERIPTKHVGNDTFCVIKNTIYILLDPEGILKVVDKYQRVTRINTGNLRPVEMCITA